MRLLQVLKMCLSDSPREVYRINAVRVIIQRFNNVVHTFVGIIFVVGYVLRLKEPSVSKVGSEV